VRITTSATLNNGTVGIQFSLFNKVLLEISPQIANFPPLKGKKEKREGERWRDEQ
jgi:hypothetical protein